MRTPARATVVALLVIGLAFLSAPSAHAAEEGRAFHSGNMKPGATWSHTFNEKGTFPYLCTYHARMVGTVIVAEDAEIEGNVTVTMKDNTNDPATLTVRPGTTVTWVNAGRQNHNVVAHGEPDPWGDLFVPAPPLALLLAVLAGVAVAARLRRAP